MLSSENLFTPLKYVYKGYSLPQRFTFPFYYQPHPLCKLAAQELQHHLVTQTQWRHDFGLTEDSETANGKMFGVLLVENKEGEVGYLAAFSGKLAEQNHLPRFVPPVFDMLAENSFFLVGQAKLNQISGQIKQLEQNPKIIELELQLKSEKEASLKEVQSHRESMIEGRKYRKQQRLFAKKSLNTDEFILVNEQLNKQSIKQKNQLRDLLFYWDERIRIAQDNLNQLTDKIDFLKDKRKKLSVSLQHKLFDNYHFLNQSGEEKNLRELFQDTSRHIPPAGAGECAAPKLLHYAFKNGLKPLAMAEFWWGVSPKSEIRQHRNFYPACQGKCQPILAHMLQGIELDKNPLLNNPAEGKTIDIIYEDEDMLVINKPAEFLSVPGKNIEDSVYLRMKLLYPQASGPLIVHRLDMSTSGLMIIALNKDVHKKLQKQWD